MDEILFEEAIEYLLESQYQLTTKVEKTKVDEGDALKITFFDGNKKIGTASVCPFNGEKTSFIYNVEVEKNLRGKGYGTAIMEYMIDKYDVKYLNVERKNEIAQNLYKKFGFVSTGPVNKNEGTCIRMERKENLKEGIELNNGDEQFLLESNLDEGLIKRAILKKQLKKKYGTKEYGDAYDKIHYNAREAGMSHKEASKKQNLN